MSISLDPEKTLKLVRYDYLNRTVVPGQILFAGSSLMEQFPVHEFQLGAGLSSLIYIAASAVSPQRKCWNIWKPASMHSDPPGFSLISAPMT